MKLNILIITQNFPPENFGNASRIHDLSKELIKFGNSVTVISPHPTFPFGNFKKSCKLFTYTENKGIKHFTIYTYQPSSPNPSFLCRMSYYLIFPIHAVVWALLKRKSYDIIITTVPPIFTGLTGLLIKKIVRKKWFFDIRDLWIDASISLGFLKENGFFEKISRRYEKMCYRICNGISVTTEEIKNNIHKTFNIPLDKIKVISNGVDTHLFTPSNKEKKNRIIYSGLLGHAQELHKFILAIKEVRKEFSVELYIVGDGDTKKELEELVKKERLEKSVIFTGRLPREEIPPLIAESLIGIAPLKNIDSLRYALPTKIFEYMACGTSFIATGQGEIQRLANESKAGFVVDSTVESISKHMVTLLKNESLRQSMERNGRIFVENYYDREEKAKELHRFIEM